MNLFDVLVTSVRDLVFTAVVFYFCFYLPGVYYWDGKSNVHVQSMLEKLHITLKSIANADTLDWDDPQDFKAWAQSRARWALGE